MGRSKKTRRCPRCNSRDIVLQDSFDDGVDLYVCSDCGHDFEVGGYRHKHRDEEYEDDESFDTEVTEDEWGG